MRSRFDLPWLLPALVAIFALGLYWLLPDVPERLPPHSARLQPLADHNSKPAESQSTYTDPFWLDHLVNGSDLHASDLYYREWLRAVVDSEHPDDQLLTTALTSGHPHVHIPLLADLIGEEQHRELTLVMAARMCQLLPGAPICAPDPITVLLRLDPSNAMPLDLMADRAFLADDIEGMQGILEQAARLGRIDYYELQITRIMAQSKARHGLAPALGDLRAFARLRASAGFIHVPFVLTVCINPEIDPQWREICVNYGRLCLQGGTSQFTQLVGWTLLNNAGEAAGEAPDSSVLLSNRKDLWDSAHEIPLTDQQWQAYLHRWETQGELEAEIQLMTELDSALDQP